MRGAPLQCVMRDERGNAYVYVVTPENKVERRNVTVTRTEGTKWLVDSGLKSGERVIFEGSQRGSGATVEPVEVQGIRPSRSQSAFLTGPRRS